MTGEVTLRGRAPPVGGPKEKLLAALGAEVRTVPIPKDNEKDLAEILDNVKKGLAIVPAATVDETIEHAPKRRPTPIEWDEAGAKAPNPAFVSHLRALTETVSPPSPHRPAAAPSRGGRCRENPVPPCPGSG